MRFDDSKIEEIKSRVDIVDLASEYLTLKKAGRNYLGLCPFHQEKTPSFTVNREKQIFYCFGCGEGGNAITLLMKMANKSFPEAIKYLAEKTGVILPARTFSSEGRAKESLHEQIVNLNYRVAQQYARNLASQIGKAARDYIQKRGLSEETVKQFRLGYAPDNWRATADFIEGAGLSLKLAEQAGLVIAGKDGGYYDRFRGRLIFPIENVFGEVIAFGGRILDAGEPKYLNSPETPVYIKGKNLYGLNKTKEAIRQKGFCLIVEGYFDAISLYNAGIHNVVATLGTALTRDHLELLRRYTQNVVALFDPDAAGRKALDRSLELFLEVGMHARALVLPGGDDPDVYVRSFGREALEDLIVHAPPISDYYIDNVLGNGKTFEENRDLVKTAKEFVNKIGDEIEKNLFIKRISEKLGIDQSLLKREVLRREGYRKPSLHVTTDSQLNSNPLEMNLIRLMLEYPQKTELIERERILDYFMDARLKVVGEKIVQDYKLLGYVDMNVILSADEDKKIREALYRLSIEAPPTDDNVVDRNFSDNIKRIREKWYKEKHRQLKIKLVQAQSSGNDELLQQLMVEKQKLMNAEREIR